MEAFKHWLNTAKAGEKFVYYTGHLARSRAAASLDTVAGMAWKAQRQGLVELVQRRTASGNGFEYIAQRTRATVARVEPALRGEGYHKIRRA